MQSEKKEKLSSAFEPFTLLSLLEDIAHADHILF